MVCQGTVEERVHRMLEEKRRLRLEVVGSEAEWLAALPDEELLASLALAGAPR